MIRSIRSTSRWVLFLVMILLVASCGNSQQVVITTEPEKTLPPPTSILAVYRTPTPTETPIPPGTPTPTFYDDPSYYYGGMLITLDNVGQTIHLKRRQSFMLSLGKDYIWDVVVEPAAVVSKNMRYTPDPGDQGVYIARDTGKASLRAVGDPLCRLSDPPCAYPSVLFRIEILVE